MREIKFRAWDTEIQEYVTSFNYNDYEISDEDGEIYITKNIETYIDFCRNQSIYKI